MHVYDIVKINNLDQHIWKDDDIFAIIGIFYIAPDDDDNDNTKLLYFAQGNILNDTIKLRYGEKLFTGKQDK
jgi:hypothetical protein